MGFNMKIAICEDDINDMNSLIDIINTGEYSTSCDSFYSSEDLLLSYYPGKYDLIFLDIYIDKMMGTELAEKILGMDKNVTIAFTTTSSEHTLASYRLGVLKYLEKPIKVKDVEDTLSLAYARYNARPIITLSIGGKEEDVFLDNIIYFEKQNQAIAVYTHNEVLYTSQSVKLSQIASMLPKTFIRSHYSYIANLSYVCGIDKELKVFKMCNGNNVYIRKQSLKKSISAYEDYLFSAVSRSR